MGRWTVFDEAAAAAARERGGQIDLRAGDDAGEAVSEALEQNSRVVAVFPTRVPGKAVVLRVERHVPEAKPVAPQTTVVAAPTPAPRAPSPAPPAVSPAPAPRKSEARVGYAAGGFLGLSDEVVLEPEEPPKPKKWWQKILD